MSHFYQVAAKAARIRFYVGMILVGLIFAAVGFVFVSLAPSGDKIETTATITDIKPIYDDSYEVIVRFTDEDGVLHEHARLNGYSSSMKIGGETTIRYTPGEYDYVDMAGGDILVYIAIAIGAVCVIAGAILLVKTIRTSAAELDGTTARDLTAPTEEEIAAVRDEGGERVRFFFRFDGHAKLNYVFEDAERRPLYEAKMQKLTFFRPFPFEIVDHALGNHRTVSVSHAVTVTYGTGAFNLPSAAACKIDGENCWEFIGRRGFSFTWEVHGLSPVYRVYHHGIEVGWIETVGRDLYAEEGKTGLPIQGFFRVEGKESDAETLFYLCFFLSRVNVFSD